MQSVQTTRPPQPWLTRRELRDTAACCLLALALAAVDIVTTGFPLVGILALPVLIASLKVGVRGTAIVFALALVLAVVAGFPDDFFGSLDHVSRFLTVAGGGVIAIYIALARDRTEQAEAGRELNRTILDSVLDNAPVGVALLDRDLRYLVVNESMAGFKEPKVESHIGLRPSEIDPSLAQIEPLLQRVLDTGRPILGIELNTTSASNGAEHQWLANYYPVYLPGGELLGVGANVVEITDRKTAEQALRASEERLQMALEGSRTAAWEWVIETNTLTASDNMGDVYGIAPGGPVGREIYESAIHPDDRELVTRMRLEAQRTGEDFGAEFRAKGSDGRQRWIELRGHVIANKQGTPEKLVGIVADISARKRQEDAIRFLAEANAILDSTLDLDELLGQLAGLAVPMIADGCMVDLLERGELRRAALAGAEPAAVGTMERVQQHTPDLDSDHPISVALRTGTTQHVVRLNDEVKTSWVESPEYQSALKQFPVKSGLIVPIKAGKQTLGTIALPSFTDPEGFDALQVWVAEELAARAAVAIGNVRMYEERARIAETLQRGLLPPKLPEVAGLELAASYRAGGAGMEVGGDFYDVFETAGRWCLLIGDVAGKGADAAAATALARYTTRGMMINEIGPSRALAAVNDVLFTQFGPRQFCTMVCAALEIAPDRLSITMSLAGHPQPLVLRAHGRIETAGKPGTLLGAIEQPRLTDSSLDLLPGDTLLLYTDGVTEMPTGEDRRLEQEGLVGLLERWDGRGAEQLVSHVETTLEQVRAGAERDDMAILVVHFPARERDDEGSSTRGGRFRSRAQVVGR